VNREALPLIIGLLTPLVLVLIIILYFYGYDFISFFKQINILYYIVILPVLLGMIFAILKWKESR